MLLMKADVKGRVFHDNRVFERTHCCFLNARYTGADENGGCYYDAGQEPSSTTVAGSEVIADKAQSQGR